MRHQVELPLEPSSPSRARRFVRWLLDEWDVETEIIEDAALLVTELVTNAIVHARTDVRLAISRHADRIDFEVTDRGQGAIRLKSPGPSSVTGRGIFMLDRLAPDWEVRSDDTSKTVHFSLSSTRQATGTSSW